MAGLLTTRFGPLDVRYDAAVLEPRPWTLAQSAWAIELSPTLGDGPILELCAGVGHIGLVVAAATGRALVQVDADAHACGLAATNAAAAGVPADIRAGEIDGALAADERFPLVLADPPYLPTAAVSSFPDDPNAAVDGGTTGLDLARRCVEIAARHLGDGGVVLLQLRDASQLTGLANDESLAVVDARDVDDHGCIALLRPPV